MHGPGRAVDSRNDPNIGPVPVEMVQPRRENRPRYAADDITHTAEVMRALDAQ